MAGTAPAWQVREMQRQYLLNDLKTRLFEQEEVYGKTSVHRVLLLVLERELSIRRAFLESSDLSDIEWGEKDALFRFYIRLDQTIRKFERCPEEGQLLRAELFKYVAHQIASPPSMALQRIEMDHSKMLYGVEDRTEEIPFK